MSWTAVVLAGSRPGRDAFAEQFDTDLKALIPVGGEPMVGRPVRALLESGEIGKIIVMTQEPGRIGEMLPNDHSDLGSPIPRHDCRDDPRAD